MTPGSETTNTSYRPALLLGTAVRSLPPPTPSSRSIPQSDCRGPSFAPHQSRRPPPAPERSRHRCCRLTQLPRCPHLGHSQRALRAAQAEGSRRYCSPPRSPPLARGTVQQGGAGSRAFTLREEVISAATSVPSPGPRPPRPAQQHSCAHFTDAKTESPAGWGFLVYLEGSFRKRTEKPCFPG
jgi:hypothetical protein